MAIRIRYQKTPNTDILRSIKNFRIVLDGKARSVYVLLSLNDLTFSILDVTSNELIKKGGDTKNKTVLFRQVKRELEKLGIVFGLEERSRGG